MPNIRAQRCDENGIYLQLSNGREIAFTAAQIRSRYQAETGGRTERRDKVIAWLQSQLQTGSELAELLGGQVITIDFDETTGRPTGLTISRAGE